jgi:UDP:flavonoid glycosyltransferase YjiC (YdhE family)
LAGNKDDIMGFKVLGLVQGEYSSHTVRVLEIAKKLRERGGFEIKFSGNGPFMERVGEEGFDWVESETVKKRHCNDTIRKFIPRVFNKWNFDHLYSVEEGLLDDEKPDIIVRDHFRELAGIAAKPRGVFDVYIQQASASPHYHFDFRPVGFPGWADKIFPEGSLLPVARHIERMVRAASSKPMHRKSEELGLTIVKESYEGAEADLVLMPDSEKIFPLEGLNGKYKYIGPMLVSGREEKPRWLENFVNDPRKKVVVTGGTTGEHEKNEVFGEAFRDGEHAVALYSSDDKKVEGFYGPGQFDLDSVLPHADVFVTHGGIGSAYMGLKHGLPMLCLFNHFEQHIVSKQLERAGVGIGLHPKDVDYFNVRGEVEKLLGEKEYRDKARGLANEIDFGNASELGANYIVEGYEEFGRD